MRKQRGPPASAKGPKSTQQAKEKDAEDALRARAVEGSPDAAVVAATTAANDKPGSGDVGGAGDTGDHQAGSQEVGNNDGVKVPRDKAEEGGKESGGEEPVALDSAAGGGASEVADAASSSVDPQEVRSMPF